MNHNAITILALETSCDDTGAAVAVDGKIISNVVASQTVHQPYGGVIPELASRTHNQQITRVAQQAVQQANVGLKDLTAIAFTQGPGLLGALLVGSSFAKALSMALQVPLIGVHHMRGHVLANLLENPDMPFPLLCLNVSGGHTQLVHAQSPLHMRVIGTTHDDAAGEALDKMGKMIGLEYPAGPAIERWASQGNAYKFSFPKPEMPGLDFSFSGLKTAFLYFVRNKCALDPHFTEENRSDLCASVQKTVIDILLSKLERAAASTAIRNIALAGGVAANTVLRDKLQRLAGKKGWTLHTPRPEYCTDNAAMIAMAAHHQYLAHDFCDLKSKSLARMPLEDHFDTTTSVYASPFKTLA